MVCGLDMSTPGRLHRVRVLACVMRCIGCGSIARWLRAGARGEARIGQCPRRSPRAARWLSLAVSLAANVSQLGPVWAKQQRLRGKVVHVSDGDTLTIATEGRRIKVRLYGVDAPEVDQPFGPRAARRAARLVKDRFVTVQVVARDRHGRTVGRVVYLSDCERCASAGQQELGETLVGVGLAWHDRRHAPRRARLARLQAGAKANKLGLWSQSNPVPPWRWRKHRNRHGRRAQGQQRHRRPARGAQARYIGNQRSKVFHFVGCDSAKCRNCTVALESAAAARKAGYRRHRSCVPPDRPPSEKRACNKSSDCTIIAPGAPCVCGPCGHYWGRAVNKRFAPPAANCPPRRCPACVKRPHGLTASCVRGQCEPNP